MTKTVRLVLIFALLQTVISLNAQNSFKDDISFLAHPQLEGRYPGTQGDSLAQEMISNRFENIGLSCLFNGSYRQPFEFIHSSTYDTAFNIIEPDRIISLISGLDYGIQARSGSDSIRTEYMFIGYGLADSLHYLMKDKAIVVYAPSGRPRLLTNNYTTTDQIIAAGAKAVINVLPADKRPVTSPRKGRSGVVRDIILLDINRGSLPLLINNDIIYTYDKELNDNKIPAFDPQLYCPVGTLELAVARIDNKITTSNIAGFKKGINDNYVLITAHYDHLARNAQTGKIYPGANDNASGVAMMLGLAEGLSEVSTMPTLVFVAFGAEERGLLGSEYFVANLPIDKERISLVINLDMVGKLIDNVLYYSVFPHKQESLFENLENGSVLTLQKSSGAGSDHISFTRASIPNVFITTGSDTGIIHTPQDSEEKINYDGMTMIYDFLEQFILTMSSACYSLDSLSQLVMTTTAVDAAQRSRFNADPQAPSRQNGTITYIFVPQTVAE